MVDGSRKAQQASTRVILSFGDNRLVRDLMGDYHSHLGLIEDRLHIEITSHGNVLTLSGDPEQVDRGRDVLEHLYGRLQSGEHIGTGEIDGAIRHAQAAPTSHLSSPPGRPSPAARAHDPFMDPQRQLVSVDARGLAVIKTRKSQIAARSPVQSQYLRAMQQADLIFGMGPAGTGKTYLAVAFAAAALERGLVDRVILSRPAIEAGERLGFLPGDIRDKVDPYLRPLFDALHDVVPAERVRRDIENGTIEIAPLAYMRGRTLAHAIVILDEAQNCTVMQMKMFLTRLGEGSKMIITGDPSQVDLPRGTHSGLVHAARLLRHVDGIAQVNFSSSDVVRSALVSRIIEAYDRETGAANQPRHAATPMRSGKETDQER